MNSIVQSLNKHIWIVIILLVSLALRLWLYTPHVPFWDASVYILMGKFFFSNGTMGLVEPFRPLAWPTFLGFLDWMGMDPIASGTIFQVLMSLGSIFLVYRIGAIVFDTRIGIIAALFLSFSPSLLFWGNCLYSEIPALFVGLSAFYFFIRERYFLAGVLAGCGFFIKFTQVIIAAILAAGTLFCGGFLKNLRPLLNFILGSVVAVCPFFILHGFQYGDVLYPFKEGSVVYGQIPYHWDKGILLTVATILTIEHPALIFAPVGLWINAGKCDYKKWMIIVAALLSVAWIGKLPTSIVRYAILGLPFLYLLSAAGFIKILDWSKGKKLSVWLWIIFTIMGAVQCFKISKITYMPFKLNSFQEYILKNNNTQYGNVWISSPTTLVFTRLKAAELMYYPVFDLVKARALQLKLSSADIIFIDTQDIPCTPSFDPACEKAKSELVHSMRREFNVLEYVDGPDGNVRAIFRKKQ